MEKEHPKGVKIEQTGQTGLEKAPSFESELPKTDNFGDIPTEDAAAIEQQRALLLKKIHESGENNPQQDPSSENKVEKREIDKALIWIVSNKFNDVKKMVPIIKEIFGDDMKVESFFRDYRFEEAVRKSEKLPATIITDGKCKTRDASGESVAIYYDYPAQFANQNDIKVISPNVLGAFLPKIFKLKMSLFGK